MKLNEASDLLNSLIAETDKKSEIKVYQRFIDILTSLKNRGLSKEEILSIEEELGTLKLTAYPENKKKYLKGKLQEFEKYLKAEFSFISKGYYTAIGMSLGISFGVALGASIFGSESGLAMGVSMGMLIGLLIGRTMDVEAEKQNRVLNTTSFL